MLFHETSLKGAYIVELAAIEDERGFFARSFCHQEFEAHGINFNIVQCNISFNKRKGTLRGMHYQAVPYQEAKMVMCTQGAIYDVIIDIRPGSSTYQQWISVELTANNHRSLYIPAGFAHGFQTLKDSTMVNYLMSNYYQRQSSYGIRADDPALNIQWPISTKFQSEKDQNLPGFSQHVVFE